MCVCVHIQNIFLLQYVQNLDFKARQLQFID